MMNKTADTLSTAMFFRLQTPKHTIGNLFFSQFIHLYLLFPKEHIIYVDISIYLKKKENRSSAPGNKSLHDVGSKERQ